MAIEMISLDAMPSIGSLSDLSDWRAHDMREDINAQVCQQFNARYDSNYFGSADDRYYQAFRNTLENHVYSVDRAARRIRDAMAVLSTDDVIRPCVTERSLRNLPPKMYNAVMSLPDLYNLHRLGRVQGWGELTPEQIKPEVSRYRRLIDFNGRLKMDTDVRRDREQWISWKYTDDDPMLTAQEICDIRATRQYVQDILDGTELDPTDLDTVRS